MIKVVEANEENMSIPIEVFEKTKEKIKETYEKTQDWDRWRFVCNIVQMQCEIDNLISCINVYRKDMDLDNNDTLEFMRALNGQLTEHGRKINELIDIVNKIQNEDQ